MADANHKGELMKAQAGQRSAFEVGIATKRKVVKVRRFVEGTGEVKTEQAPGDGYENWLT